MVVRVVTMVIVVVVMVVVMLVVMVVMPVRVLLVVCARLGSVPALRAVLVVCVPVAMSALVLPPPARILAAPPALDSNGQLPALLPLARRPLRRALEAHRSRAPLIRKARDGQDRSVVGIVRHMYRNGSDEDTSLAALAGRRRVSQLGKSARDGHARRQSAGGIRRRCLQMRKARTLGRRLWRLLPGLSARVSRRRGEWLVDNEAVGFKRRELPDVRTRYAQDMFLVLDLCADRSARPVCHPLHTLRTSLTARSNAAIWIVRPAGAVCSSTWPKATLAG